MIALCPTCSKEVNATQEGCILSTDCPDCGVTEGLLEIDHDFMDTFGFNRNKDIYNSVLVNITSDCNATCKLCYYPCEKDKHVLAETIKEQCKKLSNKRIWFSGGEPTCHSQIFEIIASVPNFTCILTNGIKFADLDYCKEFIKQTGLDENGYAKIAMSIHTNMQKKKYQALDNFRELGIKINCGMFSINSLEEIPETIKIWSSYEDVVTHARIRTPFNSWMQKDVKKLFLSDVYKTIKEILPQFEITDNIGGNSIFDVNLKYNGRYLFLCSAPGSDAFPIEPLQYAPKMLALDGNIYAVPHALRVNEAYCV